MVDPQPRPSLKPRLWRAILARLPVAFHAWAVVVEMMVPELAKAGIVETTGRKGLLGWLYWGYWWAATLLLLVFLPASAEQVSLYFPAVIGVAAAWLFAVPAYAQSLTASADFSPLRPSANLLSDFVAKMKARPIKMPPGLENEAEVAAASAQFSEELPALFPSTLLTIMAQLSTRVVVAAIFGVGGLLLGPWLASIHVTWLHGWSPINLLYALTAPVLPLLFGSMLIPIIGYAYLAYRRSIINPAPEP